MSLHGFAARLLGSQVLQDFLRLALVEGLEILAPGPRLRVTLAAEVPKAAEHRNGEQRQAEDDAGGMRPHDLQVLANPIGQFVVLEFVSSFSFHKYVVSHQRKILIASANVWLAQT